MPDYFFLRISNNNWSSKIKLCIVIKTFWRGAFRYTSKILKGKGQPSTWTKKVPNLVLVTHQKTFEPNFEMLNYSWCIESKLQLHTSNSEFSVCQEDFGWLTRKQHFQKSCAKGWLKGLKPFLFLQSGNSNLLLALNGICETYLLRYYNILDIGS